MIVFPCKYDGPDHEFPDDWIFGGANMQHPAPDPRWRPTTYEYYDAQAKRIHIAQDFMCDDEAIDKFTWVANLGPMYNPVWLSATRPVEGGGYKTEMLPWTYDKATDIATERSQ